MLVQGTFDRTRPALSVPVEERELQGARLLVITVPRGATHYADVKGTATRRVGNQCRPFPPEEQRQALAARGLYDWSAELSGMGIDSTDGAELERVRRLLRAAGRSDTADRDANRLLSDLRLMVDGELTRAAVLLLGLPEVIHAEIPAYGYAYRYRPSPGSEAEINLRENRPLLAAVERLIDAIEPRRTTHTLNTAGGVQLQLHDYSGPATRELIVNALVHRDYELEGAVEVEHTPDRLTVSNPGGLVFGVTPDNILTHPSTPRNRLLLETIALLQVAERTGQGVDRVYREVLRIGKPPPDYRDSGGYVEVGLQGGGGNDAFTRFVTTSLDAAQERDIEVLLALNHLRRHRTVTAEQLASSLQRTATEGQQVLERMSRTGLVEPSKRTARKPFPTYALTSRALASMGRSVSYHRQDNAEVVTKVAEHVNEYGHITNQTLRRMFDVGVYPARDMLRDLQERGILEKVGDRVAGPGVRYGPGPKLPEVVRRPTQGRGSRTQR
jgi:ATP-dependent DNA helicase RecG